MTQYVINIGALPNDGTGDPLRTAFNDVNLNFDQVFAAGPVLSNIQIANNKILTTNTNGNLILAPNGIGVVQSNVNIVPNTSNIRSLGTGTQRWSSLYVQYANISGNIDLAGSFTVGDLSVTGNLTVTGNTIQIGNLVTDAKTLQLSNTAGTANSANGSGITVGANDDIATLLYNSTGNVWTTNIGVTAVGNISAPYFVGDGSQLTGLPVSYSNADVSTYLASGTNSANIITSGNISGTNITGNIVAPDGNGSVVFNDAGILGADAGFNYDKTTNTLYVESGSFAGNSVTGVNGLYAGLPSFTILGSPVMAQFTGNVTNYSQINFQNTSNSVVASGDYIITADNGNDTTHFVDLGITSSSWDGTQENSLGNVLSPGDGYLYVQDGNLTLGTKNGATARVWTFDINGNVTIPGNLNGSGASPAPSINGFDSINAVNFSASGNITGGNILTGGDVSVTGDIIGNTISANGDLSAIGNVVGTNIFGNGAGITGVATQTTGSWTLAAGTNTANITVPLNGTYSLWVRGNIPNGIIVWNATVTVTNTNVPVIGSQYAWNYEAGNALALTSIPQQIIGTAGVISNASPSVGTTTNVFEFVIDNNSGNSQVVDWGYTIL